MGTRREETVRGGGESGASSQELRGWAEKFIG